ncbi:MAG: F0F1 ATP synthase subunit delta [Gammaproteobacteria bacterium]|nr:F0F1 ATP synthase subunit delta [Gammaproteobacteria bacterium]
MADLSNLARPYAQAACELAEDAGDLAAWGDRLDFLSSIAADPTMDQLLKNPDFGADRQVDLILHVAGDRLDADGANLVRLLVRNGRVNALPAIAALYAEMRAQAERVVEADMITAAAIDEDQQAAFSDALQSRLGRHVKLNFSVDESLIGGAVIRAGDWVIDGSVKAQLEQLVGAVAN